MISTAIVNAVGTYAVRNMKQLFKANGRGDEVLQWWHGANDAKNEWSDPAVQLTLDMEDGSQDTLECVLPAPAVETYKSAWFNPPSEYTPPTTAAEVGTLLLVCWTLQPKLLGLVGVPTSAVVGVSQHSSL